MDITSEKTAPATAEPAAHVSGLSRAAMCLLGASLMLIAFNLRPIFASLSVLLPEIVEQTGLSSAAAGYLTTLPVLCLGLFAPLAPKFAQRYGVEHTLLGMLEIGRASGRERVCQYV